MKLIKYDITHKIKTLDDIIEMATWCEGKFGVEDEKTWLVGGGGRGIYVSFKNEEMLMEFVLSWG